MTWFALGAAAVGVVTNIVSGRSQARQAVAQQNAANRAQAAQIINQSKAEADSIVNASLNATIRNAYAASIAQQELALKKQQAARQKADISAASLAAQGAASANASANESIGASVDAVASDIQQKAQQAADDVDLQWRQDVQNYNRTLDEIVLNQAMDRTRMRSYNVDTSSSYSGPNMRDIVALSLMNGAAQWGLGYAQRRMQLGAGTPRQAGKGLYGGSASVRGATSTGGSLAAPQISLPR